MSEETVRVRIHWIDNNGFQDEMVIEADTIDELREIANREIKKRNAVDYWSSAC